MKHLGLFLSAAAVILMAQRSPAQSGTFAADHMVCYSIRDPKTLKSTADMFAWQPDFSQQGCTLLKPIEFCVPASKTNVQPAPPDQNIIGQPLTTDYICYAARCPKIPPPSKQVIDQFGARLQKESRVTKICVPAKKTPAGCPVGPRPAGAMCSGACPSSTQLCKTIKTATGPECRCVDQTTPCGGSPDAAGLCGGTCADPNDVCRPGIVHPNPTSPKQALLCTCQKPPPPVCSLNTVTGECGGTCPKDPTAKCVHDPNDPTGKRCTCDRVGLPCHQTGTAAAPMCAGACDDASQTCQFDALRGDCNCNPPTGCTQNLLTGKCGGDCTAPQVCIWDSAHTQCNCQDPPCTSTGGTGTAPSCGGACLSGQQCALDAAGACNCQCLPTSCSPIPCPNGQSCGLVPGTTLCQCH